MGGGRSMPGSVVEPDVVPSEPGVGRPDGLGRFDWPVPRFGGLMFGDVAAPGRAPADCDPADGDVEPLVWACAMTGAATAKAASGDNVTCFHSAKLLRG